MSLEHPHLPDPPNPTGNPALETDLLPLMADLDRLAAADRAAPAPGLEDRLMQTTLASLHGVQPTAAQVAELASLDRASAPRDLEVTVYESSLPALREHAVAAPRLVLHDGGTNRNERRHVRQAWWSRSPVRLAAAIVFVAGAAIAVRVTNTTGSGVSSDGVKGEMDMLYAAMESRPSGDSSSDSALDTDTEDLTKWLLDGASS